MHITFEGPAIMVTDMQASRAFYEGLLGQEILADFGENIPFKSGFSIWQADHASEVIFSGRQPRPAQLAQDNFELYFECTELDALWERITDTWDDIIHPILTAPWGQRGFRLRDPDGHIVEVGEPLPILVQRLLKEGLTPEQIAERTSIPVEMVTAMAEG